MIWLRMINKGIIKSIDTINDFICLRRNLPKVSSATCLSLSSVHLVVWAIIRRLLALVCQSLSLMSFIHYIVESTSVFCFDFGLIGKRAPDASKFTFLDKKSLSVFLVVLCRLCGMKIWDIRWKEIKILVFMPFWVLKFEFIRWNSKPDLVI